MFLRFCYNLLAPIYLDFVFKMNVFFNVLVIFVFLLVFLA